MSQRNSATKKRLKHRLFGGHATKPCCFCRRPLTPATATLEHVLPLSQGGGWHVSNLRLSCATCNNDRGSTDFTEYRKRRQPKGV